MINHFLAQVIFWDLRIEQKILLWRNADLDRFFYLVTFLGQWLVITLLSIFLIFLLIKYKKKFLIKPFVVTVLGSGLFTVLLKALVGRARPIGDPFYIEKLPSFPSAHAALALAFFGFLIYILCRSKLNLTSQIFSILVLFLLILIIGFSRLYLGVHFLTDVLAGYLVGLLWVLIGLYLSRRR